MFYKYREKFNIPWHEFKNYPMSVINEDFAFMELESEVEKWKQDNAPKTQT